MAIRMSRRHLLRTTGAAVVGASLASAAACASEEGGPAGGSDTTDGAPEETFTEPTTKISGDLSILMWSHFVPSHDEWFAGFVQRWAERTGVNVRVDHIDNADIPTRIAAEIQAGQGHDLVQYIAPLSQFEPSVLDMTDVVEEANRRWGEQLEVCRASSFNPATGKFYAFSPGWVPDPGNYRRSLWEPIGMPDGPRTWDELLEGGAEIMRTQGVQMGLGMSQEIDSNMVLRALMWSFGASVQDENERVVLNSPETIEALEYMKRLYENTMTEEVFAWNAASNNQGLVAGSLSYIVNSISAWRTAQETNPDVADDTFFVPALEGPAGGFAAQHVLYNWIIPNHAANPDAAKEFLLHYTENFAAVCYHSKLYDFCAWPERTPQLNEWLRNDPFGSNPPDKLALLTNALDWTVNIGYPGPANTAVGEVFNTFVIPNMFARVARGEQTPQESVEEATREVEAIFERWRAEGLVGG
ncbi:MAG: extracellular solute-binding protein [Micromonosporaceae bacterium]|jgi:ABC-type glycerol-3-phosphate transport system substrate-binding protein